MPVAGELPDALDLQVEYWTVAPRMELAVDKVERSTRKEMKCSLKMSLHSLRVFRSPVMSSSSADPSSLLSMVIVTPEKKQKSESSCTIVVTGKKCNRINVHIYAGSHGCLTLTLTFLSSYIPVRVWTNRQTKLITVSTPAG